MFLLWSFDIIFIIKTSKKLWFLYVWICVLIIGQGSSTEHYQPKYAGVACFTFSSKINNKIRLLFLE